MNKDNKFYPVIKEKAGNKIAKFRNFFAIEDEEHYMTPYVRIILGFLAIFVIWAIFAPINSYVIASGKIIVSGSKKSISHLEGGLIEEILVREGQFVEEGQDLIVLSKIQAQSKNDSTKKHLIATIATKIRLSSERDEQESLDFSEIEKNFELDEEEKKVLITQAKIFENRTKNRQEKLDILSKKIVQTKQEIAGYLAQKEAISKTIEALQKESEIIEDLVDEGGVSLTRKLDIDKEIGQSQGRFGEINANIARLESVISQTELEIINFQSEEQKEILKELHENEIAMSDFDNEYQATSDILGRTSIKTPVAGYVMDLQYQTKGSVIPPAMQIMFIVPKDDILVAEVKIKPQDIDLVAKDMEAKIQLSAYKTRLMPKLNGKVIFVSADSFKDEATQEIYFKARVEISDSELKKLKENVRLVPGMPVDGFIITGQRSMMSYLLTPIKEVGFRAFREE